MASSDSEPLMIGLRGTQGIQLHYGPPRNEQVEFFTSLKVDSRFMVFSPHGRYLVYHTPTGVQLTDIVNKETLDLGPGTVLVRDAAFSPQEGYLVLWDAPSKKEDNSCTVYDLKTRTVKALYSQTETTWKVRWSNDEQLLFLMGKDQTYVFDDPEFSTPVSVPKARIGELSISHAPKPYHVIVFNPYKSTPSFVRLYKYPNIDDPSMALAARSLVKEDQVLFKWNVSGTYVLFLSWADVTDDSYYGSSTLFMMNTSCDSLIVSLDKEGPIHAWEWNPAGDTFCVIYGFMPGKIGLFNKKADLVHTFPGSQYRNGMLYNPFGSLLVLYGHGNIRGAFEVWDMKLMKKVSSQDSEYMTNLEWSPDGSILLAATTSPRLKVSNKHTFYHYTGKQLLDKPYSGELFQVCWRGAPPGTYKAPDPTVELGANYVPNEPKKASAYVPPSLRARGSIVGLEPEAGASVHFAAQALKHSSGSVGSRAHYIPGLTLDEDGKKKPKQRKKKPKTEGDAAGEKADSGSTQPRSAPQNIDPNHSGRVRAASLLDPHSGSPSSYPSGYRRNSRHSTDWGRPRSGTGESQNDGRNAFQNFHGPDRKPQQRPSKPKVEKRASKPSGSPEPEPDVDENNQIISSGDPERDKKVARLNKKLVEINALKQEQASGKVLEKNQLEKIKRMDSVVRDLEKLQLSAILKKK